MHEIDIIFITGLEFYGYHGASDEEQAIGHRYQVDVRLGVDTKHAAATDGLADTVNYADVTRAIVDIGRAGRFRLVEALAQRLVDHLFEQFPRIQTIEIRLLKRLPPLDAIVQSVGVEIRRSRAILTDIENPTGDGSTFDPMDGN